MRTTPQDQETKMKTTLFLSTLAAGVLAVSTATFAQNFGGYAQAYGDAAVTRNATPNWSYTVPVDRFARSDFGYQGKVTAPRNQTTRSRAPVVAEPAPAQEQ